MNFSKKGVLDGEIIENISLRVQEIRKKHKITQDEMAALIGSSKQNISNLERGKTIPKLTIIVALAKKFHVSTDWLIFGDVPKNRSHVIKSIKLHKEDLDYANQVLLKDLLKICKKILSTTNKIEKSSK